MRDRAGSARRRLERDLNRSLFPPSPESTWKGNRWETALVVVGFLVLAVVLQLFRVGPSEATSTVWAEDGPFFLAGAVNEGFFDMLTSTYAGYLVVAQRLIGELGALVPLGDASVAIALGGCAVVAASGLAVWVGSAGHISSPALRGLLTALTVLCPVASLEAVASGTYVSWYMTFAVFWLLLWRPRSDWGAILGGLFIFIAGLSGPGTFFFVPLALLRAVAIRDRRDGILVGAFALAFAIQLPATLLSDEHVSDPAWTKNIATAYLQRVLDGAVLGEELGGRAWGRFGWPFLAALALAFTGLIAWLAARATSGRLLAAIAILTSGAMFVLSAYQRALGTALMWPEGAWLGVGGRYAIVPALLLVSALLVLVDGRLRSSAKGWRDLWLPVGAAAVLALALVTSFWVGDRNIRGSVDWDASLRAAAAECRKKDLPLVAVYTSPPGVTAPLYCEKVEGAFESSGAR